MVAPCTTCTANAGKGFYQFALKYCSAIPQAGTAPAEGPPADGRLDEPDQTLAGEEETELELELDLDVFEFEANLVQPDVSASRGYRVQEAAWLLSSAALRILPPANAAAPEATPPQKGPSPAPPFFGPSSRNGSAEAAPVAERAKAELAACCGGERPEPWTALARRAADAASLRRGPAELDELVP
eukprot:tig00020801_g13910.t1